MSSGVPPSQDRPLQVLLIHGTFASATADSGDQWWQRSSEFQRGLSARLSRNADVQPSEAVFHWSGANSELERRDAARRLARIIKSYEATQTQYVLVCHSHGGSVAWHALNEARSQNGKLDNLHALVTVGTPFLHVRIMRSKLWQLLPLAISVMILLWIFGYANDSVSSFQSSFEWSNASSLVALFCMTLLAATLLICVRALGLLPLIVLQRWRAAAMRRTLELIRDRCLFLASPEDEAINGLTQTLRFEGNLLPRTSWLNRVANSFASRGDEFIWTTLARKAQGCDLAWAEITDVTTGPLPESRGTVLPALINQRINEQADRAAHGLLKRARQALAMSSAQRLMLTDLERLVVDLVTAKEAVHCQYFDDTEIVGVIAQFINEPKIPSSEDNWRPKQEQPGLPSRLNSLWTAVLLSIVCVASGWIFYRINEPLTDRAQAEIALNSAPVRRLPYIGKVNANEYAIDRFLVAASNFRGPERAMQLAESIDELDVRIVTLSKLARSFRLQGRPSVEALDRALRSWVEWERVGWERLRTVLDKEKFPQAV